MIRLSWKRKTLIAGAAGICIAVPAALSLAPQFGPRSVRAAEPVRNPNHVLHAAVERELSELGIDAGADMPVIQPTAGEIQPVQGQAPGFNQQQYQSEVQRQLQMLYQQDGRPMPNMVPTPQVSPEVWQQYQQQNGTISGRRPSRWDWLKPQNWRRNWQRTFGGSAQPTPQPPEAPEFNPDSLNEPGQLPGQLTNQTPAQAPAQAPPTLMVHPLDTARQQQPRPQQRLQQQATAPAVPPATRNEPEQPRLFPGLLEEMQTPVAESATATEPPTLILMPLAPEGELSEPVAAPGVATPRIEPRRETPVAGGIEQQPETPVAGGVSREEPDLDAPFTRERLPQLDNVVQERTAAPSAADPLLDPFPELPEERADERTGPYSGLELELDPFAEPAPSSSTAAPPSDSANPFAPFVERSAEASIRVRPQLPQVDEVGPSLQGPGLPSEPGALPNVELRELPAAAQVSSGFSEYSPAVQQKMSRIAARRGLTGLKGFCPVVLRDHRDLEDARAEYTVIYAGTQYWFSSEEAKQAFLMAPEAYAPIKGGIDLVDFENSGEEHEGLLDHAAWFQGRLHLFQTAENKAAFIANPRAYSQE